MGSHTDIRWEEWGEEAFQKAKAAEKPILLDLSAVWCHWCHVMDETSYSDDEIIGLINSDFVPIRVDIDRRPDIRERYNFGGYPTTAFLNGEGEIISGGTYIPPDQMKRALVQIKAYFDRTGGVVDHSHRSPPEVDVEAPQGGLNEEIYEDVLGHLLQQYDEAFGGFGAAPKFPQPDVLDLALYQYQTSGNDFFRKMVEKTLDGMVGGGMYDPVEGGFFRYSVTRDWTEPHYEKMLDVNVGLLRNYLYAYAVLENKAYRDVAVDVLRYLEASLRDPEDGFWGSQDADEVYYPSSREEREQMEVPYIDRTVYADLSGQAIEAYLLASSILGEDSYREAALAALTRLEEQVMTEDGSFFHYWDGSPHVDALLSDYVSVARAFLSAFEHTGEDRYLERAEALVQDMMAVLTEENGVLRDRRVRDDDIGLLREGQKPLMDNAHAALLLLKLQELTRREDYGKAAAQILEGFGNQYRRYAIFASGYALALEAHRTGVLKVDVVHDGGPGGGQELLAPFLRAFQPGWVVQPLQVGSRRFHAANYPEEPVPAIYACKGTVCSPPITSPTPLQEVEAFAADLGAPASS
ncbi:MAG: thioredoxin domain-containing protein [Thermoplasmata archaeon]